MDRAGNDNMGRVTIEITVANNQDVQMVLRSALPPGQVRNVRLQAIVDTGSTHLVLPEAVGRQLGLPFFQMATVRYANSVKAQCEIVDQARIEVLGRFGTYKAILEPGRTDALIGAIVLEDLDLLVDCTTQQLLPRDPQGAVYLVE